MIRIVRSGRAEFARGSGDESGVTLSKMGAGGSAVRALKTASSTRPVRVVPFAPKVTAPRIHSATLPRDALVERLCADEATELFIGAPAGYGKSTLLALWAERDERPFAWMTADEGDNDPVVLLTYLALALDSLTPPGFGLVEQVTATEYPWPEMLASIADAVAAMSTPFVLVVDDVHELEGTSRTKVLSAIARRVPPGSTIALGTRGRRPYPMSRGLLAGQSTEIGVGELSMDGGEAAALLRASGVEATREVADALHDKTEGWPAGLYIAALALRNADDPERAVQEFTGGDRSITDYVTEEILTAIPLDVVEFLLSTAVLSRLSGELCDHALGANGSGAVLDELARDNRFVIPLDHHGGWYRYHHLFGEVLLQAMRARDPARVQDVTRRASEWFAERGEVEPAVEHALAGSTEDAPALDLALQPPDARHQSHRPCDPLARPLRRRGDRARPRARTDRGLGAVGRRRHGRGASPHHSARDGTSPRTAGWFAGDGRSRDPVRPDPDRRTHCHAPVCSRGAGGAVAPESVPADRALPGRQRGELPR